MRRTFRPGAASLAAALVLAAGVAGTVVLAAPAPGPGVGVPVVGGGMDEVAWSGPVDPDSWEAAGLVIPGPARVHFKDAPPARVTGGFGEDSCHACHWNGPENDGEGIFAIDGLPDTYSPGEEYSLTVTLTHPEMAVAGFQLATRLEADGAQAGGLSVPEDEKGRVGVLVEGEVEFAHHLLGGIELHAPGEARWTVLWAAPTSGDPVLLHASALAGDGDDSQIGDRVYTVELETYGR